MRLQLPAGSTFAAGGWEALRGSQKLGSGRFSPTAPELWDPLAVVLVSIPGGGGNFLVPFSLLHLLQHPARLADHTALPSSLRCERQISKSMARGDEREPG